MPGTVVTAAGAGAADAAGCCAPASMIRAPAPMATIAPAGKVVWRDFILWGSGPRHSREPLDFIHRSLNDFAHAQLTQFGRRAPRVPVHAILVGRGARQSVVSYQRLVDRECEGCVGQPGMRP